MKLSVIIPCLNEEDYVGRLLGQLHAQDLSDFEVLVVDSGSEDGTVAVAQAFQDRLDLRLVETGRGVARARNAGAEQARGEWLLFLDADVQLPRPDFLRGLVAGAEAKGYVTAAARFRADSRRWGDRLLVALTMLYLRALAQTRHPVASGFCILTQKAAFQRVGGFDPDLRVGEDYDYVTRSVGGRRRRFGFVGGPLITSLRRFQEEGTLRFVIKSIRYELYRFRHGYKIAKDPFNYQFGKHRKPK